MKEPNIRSWSISMAVFSRSQPLTKAKTKTFASFGPVPGSNQGKPEMEERSNDETTWEQSYEMNIKA